MYCDIYQNMTIFTELGGKVVLWNHKRFSIEKATLHKENETEGITNPKCPTL